MKRRHGATSEEGFRVHPDSPGGMAGDQGQDSR